MAKSYTISTTLDSKQVELGLRQVNSLITATTREANSMNKAMKISGDFSAGVKGAEGLKKALSLAEDRSNSLRSSLSKAKMDGSSANTVADLEAKLKRSDSEAQELKNSLAGINNEGKKGETDLLGTFSKVGNIATGAIAVFNVLKDTVGAVVGTAVDMGKTFVNGFVSQYDTMATANLTLANTLKDGKKGLEDYNNEIKKSPALVRAQKSELDQMAATISSYSDTTGKDAFKIVNAINAVGDSVGANIEDQKGFTRALGQAMTAGKLMAQDFNQMSQTALGKQFKAALIDAANAAQGVGRSAADMSKDLETGKVTAVELSNVFGSDWTNKMQAVMQNNTGLKTSAGMVNDALKQGKLTADDFKKALGDDYLQKLTDAANANKQGAVTSETFRSAMEEGTFTSDILQAALGRLIEQGEKVPQVFSTFEQVKMSVQNAFYTGAVEAFMEKMVGSKDKLNEFGQSATEFAQNAGTQLGGALGTAAQKVSEFIDANGGIEGIFNTMTTWTDAAIGKFQAFAENILIVIGNLLSLTKGTAELEKMGFQVDQNTGMVVGWKAQTDEAKKKQEEWNKKLSEMNQIMPTTTNEMEKAGKASGNLELTGERGSKGLDKVGNSADFATGKLWEANQAANQAKDAVKDIQGTVYVDASGAIQQLSWLIDWADAASGRLRGLSNNYGNMGRQYELRAEGSELMHEGARGIERASKAFGALEHYNAARVAQGMPKPPPQNNSTVFGAGAIQISVGAGANDNAIAELEAKLRRLGIRIY